ncbi:hypothetical protein NKR19_g2379 [Coniochaeta hoffmannii]|uniref:Uncharacterized protein n=1 Tax=Coniochaeta hoffmannii TaxID=91930 RepID=A0AA38VZW0_9PEZI|nr:hypothetical protein NKR19_g2379 [Coniochaeta hoffmannii]
MNGVQPLEPHMDSVIKELWHQLESRFMDDAHDPKNYAWDVVGKVTFSQTIGYLDQGRDFDGALGVADQALDYFSWIKGLGPPGFENIATMSVQHLVAQYQGLDKDIHDPAQPDSRPRGAALRKMNDADLSFSAG